MSGQTADGREPCAALIRCQDGALRGCLFHDRGRRFVGETSMPFCRRHCRMIAAGRPVLVSGGDGRLVILHGGQGYVVPRESVT